jgi:hypothetical protein
MALGLGEGGEQSAPLGRAVIGGLLVATFATLFVLPSVFTVLLGRSSTQSVSLDPDDPGSSYFERGGENVPGKGHGVGPAAHEPHPIQA